MSGSCWPSGSRSRVCPRRREPSSRAREVREALRALLIANNEGGSVHRRRRGDARAGRPPARTFPSISRRLSSSRSRTGSTAALGRVLAAAFACMQDGSWSRLKACRNCHWAFYDESRNRSAAWCSMQLCGNRMKIRAYRRPQSGRVLASAHGEELRPRGAQARRAEARAHPPDHRAAEGRARGRGDRAPLPLAARAARLGDALRADDRREREPRHRAALPEVPPARGLPRRARRRSSSATSTRPASSGRRRRRSAGR